MRRKKAIIERFSPGMMGKLATSSSLSKPKVDWGILFRVIALGIWCLAAGACGHPISSLVRTEADSSLTLSRVVENPKIYLGSVVIWGGIISKVSQGPEGTRLLLIQTPLDSNEYPQTQIAEGEFIARTPESLDPQVYRKGQVITLAGEIEGLEEKNLRFMEYPRPVLRIIEAHPWEKESLPLSHGNWKGEFNFPSSPFEEPFLNPGNE